MSREGGNERKIVWSRWRYRFARVARDGNDPAGVPSLVLRAPPSIRIFLELVDTARFRPTTPERDGHTSVMLPPLASTLSNDDES